MRILVLVHGRLDGRLSGPEIRGFEIARALADRHRVTVAVRDPAGDAHEGIPLVPSSRRRLLREALRHDVVIAPSVPPFLYALKAFGRLRIVADLYDPVEVELASVGGHDRQARTARAEQAIQLRFADIVVCAGRRQRERLEEERARVRPNVAAAPIGELPFGLPAPPPPARRQPLRERFPAIAPADRVVLWWGSIWPWLDAESAIVAFAAVAAERPDLKLVFASGRRADAASERFSAVESARSLAAARGLLGRSVFFVDDWIPYEDRHEYLREADLGLVLHRDTPEARLAARARYMDYLWAGLPCLLAHGDEVAAELQRGGFAELVPPNEPVAVATALRRALDDPAWLREARQRSEALAEAYRWPTLVEPLSAALEQGSPGRLAGRDLVRFGGSASGYYARRLADGLA